MPADMWHLRLYQSLMGSLNLNNCKWGAIISIPSHVGAQRPELLPPPHPINILKMVPANHSYQRAQIVFGIDFACGHVKGLVKRMSQPCCKPCLSVGWVGRGVGWGWRVPAAYCGTKAKCTSTYTHRHTHPSPFNPPPNPLPGPV